MTLTRGIDVSDVQTGVIDWHAIAGSGVAFAYHRCGDGNDPPDPNFAERARGARDAGLLVGAYAVGMPLPVSSAHPGREPDVQARTHYQQCGGLGSGAGEMPPMLDLEWPVPGSPEWKQYGLTPAFVRGWALTYLETAASLWGVLPLLYDGFPDYIGVQGIDAAAEPRLASYPLWVVDYPAAWSRSYPADADLVVVPAPWTVWTLWQANGGGVRLPGGQPVDADVFNGDLAALQAFACGRTS